MNQGERGEDEEDVQIYARSLLIEKEGKVTVTQSCLTLCNPMDCSLPGSSVHGILQARILEWVPISFFRGSSWPRDRTQVFCIVGRFFTIWATREYRINRGGWFYQWRGKEEKQNSYWTIRRINAHDDQVNIKNYYVNTKQLTPATNQ